MHFRGQVVLFSGLDSVLHAVAFALDGDNLGVMEESVEDGGGNNAVVVEGADRRLGRGRRGDHDFSY